MFMNMWTWDKNNKQKERIKNAQKGKKDFIKNNRKIKLLNYKSFQMLFVEPV